MARDHCYDRHRHRHRHSHSRSRKEDGDMRSESRGSRKAPDGHHSGRQRSRDRRRRSESPGRHHRRRYRDDERQCREDRRSDRDRYGSRKDKTHHSHSDRKSEDGQRGEDGKDWDPERRLDSRSAVKRGGPLPSQEASFAITNGQEAVKPKEMPNFGSSGVLAAASNSVAQADGTSVVLKYHEPPEARKPSARDQWKLFVFKGDDIVDTLDLGLRSCWLIGREVTVVDLLTEHPSISKQHAVIQFRYTEKRNEYGDKIGRVKPYLIDLESANGTTLNHDKIPDSRYLELRDKDTFQFGHSTREYVIMLAPRD